MYWMRPSSSCPDQLWGPTAVQEVTLARAQKIKQTKHDGHHSLHPFSYWRKSKPHPSSFLHIASMSNGSIKNVRICASTQPSACQFWCLSTTQLHPLRYILKAACCWTIMSGQHELHITAGLRCVLRSQCAEKPQHLKPGTAIIDCTSRMEQVQ